MELTAHVRSSHDAPDDHRRRPISTPRRTARTILNSRSRHPQPVPPIAPPHRAESPESARGWLAHLAALNFPEKRTRSPRGVPRGCQIGHKFQPFFPLARATANLNNPGHGWSPKLPHDPNLLIRLETLPNHLHEHRYRSRSNAPVGLSLDGLPFDLSKLNAQVHIIPFISMTSPISLQCLSPSHFNFRIKASAAQDETTSTPTPIYIAHCLQCLTPKLHPVSTYALKQDSLTFSGALALLPHTALVCSLIYISRLDIDALLSSCLKIIQHIIICRLHFSRQLFRRYSRGGGH